MPKRLSKSESTQLDIAGIPAETGELPNHWLTVSYQPVSLFSLKRSDATSMAARSNLVPQGNRMSSKCLVSEALVYI